MDRIHYAGGSVLTGTAIAKALLEYAEALAKNEDSSTIDIPTLNPDGTVGRAALLVGPASEIVSESETSGFDEVEDEQLVARLVELASHVSRKGRAPGEQVVKATAATPGEIAPDIDLDLDLS